MYSQGLIDYFRQLRRTGSKSVFSDHDLLGLASAFRRPRHFIAIRKVAQGEDRKDVDASRRIHKLIARYTDESRSKPSGRDRKIFFLYLEGGFYQMVSAFRNAIYHSFALEGREDMNSRDGQSGATRLTLAEAHKRAANYYELLFLSSNRPLCAAFFESIFHTVAANRVRHARDAEKRLEKLTCEDLLTRGLGLRQSRPGAMVPRCA